MLEFSSIPIFFWFYMGIALLGLYVARRIITNPTDELYRAVDSGDVEAVQSLMAKGVNPNLSHQGKALPLYGAAFNGEFEIVKLLVEYGADINHGLQLQGGINPLLAATVGRHPKIVNFLIQKGAKAEIH